MCFNAQLFSVVEIVFYLVWCASMPNYFQLLRLCFTWPWFDSIPNLVSVVETLFYWFWCASMPNYFQLLRLCVTWSDVLQCLIIFCCRDHVLLDPDVLQCLLIFSCWDLVLLGLMCFNAQLFSVVEILFYLVWCASMPTHFKLLRSCFAGSDVF